MACDFDNPSGLSSNFTIHDFQNAVWHNGAARSVTTTAATAVAGTVVTAAAGHFVAGDVGHTISGAGVPSRAFIKAITATTATLNVPVCGPVSTACPVAGPIPVGAVLLIENSRARTVKDATTTASGAVVTSTTANFTAADVGKSISGSTIPDGKTIASVTATTATLAGGGAGVTAGTAQVVTIAGTLENTTTRQVGDATYTAGNHVTSVLAKFVAADDIGLPVTGTGIAVGAYITAVAGNVATLSAAVTVTAGAHTIVIGKPTVTAPKDGDAAAQLASILDLSPTLVAGSNACSLNKPEGFTIQGTWHNPGTFTPATFPAGALIAQIQFNTAVVAFYGYVAQKPAATVGDPQAAAHYDVLFPSLPTALAKCPPPSTVPVGLSLGLNATTASQSGVKTGVGKPSTAAVRVLRANNGPSLTTTGYMKSNAAAPANWQFSQTCVMANPIVVDFHCGNG